LPSIRLSSAKTAGIVLEGLLIETNAIVDGFADATQLNLLKNLYGRYPLKVSRQTLLYAIVKGRAEG